MTTTKACDLCTINVRVHCYYNAEDSDPANGRYSFTYDIKLENAGQIGAKLLQRHWFIMDGHGHVQETRGTGVVGEQPYLGPGDTFEYTSFVVINTPIGNMFGTYEMIADNGQIFMVEIQNFQLIKADSVH
jgi:ApaG protein